MKKCIFLALTLLVLTGCAKHSGNSRASESNFSKGLSYQNYKKEMSLYQADCVGVKSSPQFSSLANKIPLTWEELKSPPLNMLALKTKPTSTAELNAIVAYSELSQRCANRLARINKEALPNVPKLAKLPLAAQTVRKDSLMKLYEKQITYGEFSKMMGTLTNTISAMETEELEAAIEKRQVDNLQLLQLGWALSGANPANQTNTGPRNTTCNQYGNQIRCESY